MVYVANVGDSRAIMSSEFGTKAESISNDHKPSELSEQTRIIAGGGRVY
jgi:protein phosphatase 2C family protein 2/3